MGVSGLKAGHSNRIEAGNNPVNFRDPDGLYPVGDSSDPNVARAQEGYGQTVEAPEGDIPLSPIGEIIADYHPGVQNVEAAGEFYEKASTGTLTSGDAWDIIGSYVLGKLTKGKKKKSRPKRGELCPDDLDSNLENLESLEKYEATIRKNVDDSDAFIKGTNRTSTDYKDALNRYKDDYNRGQ